MMGNRTEAASGITTRMDPPLEQAGGNPSLGNRKELER